MKYVIMHKKNRTYYCFDKEEKYKHFSVDGTKVYKFNSEKSARRIINKFNHPENWKIIKVREIKTNRFN